MKIAFSFESYQHEFNATSMSQDMLKDVDTFLFNNGGSLSSEMIEVYFHKTFFPYPVIFLFNHTLFDLIRLRSNVAIGL